MAQRQKCNGVFSAAFKENQCWSSQLLAWPPCAGQEKGQSYRLEEAQRKRRWIYIKKTKNDFKEKAIMWRQKWRYRMKKFILWRNEQDLEGKYPKKILRKICFMLHNTIFLLNTASGKFFKPFAIIFANAQRPRYYMLQKEKRNIHDMYNFSTFKNSEICFKWMIWKKNELDPYLCCHG